MKSVGYQLKIIRESQSLTLIDVAKLTEINFTALSRIENDERNPTEKQLRVLADVYKINFLDFFEELLSDRVVSILRNYDNYGSVIHKAKKKLNASKNNINK